MTDEAFYQEAILRLARAASGAGRLEAPDGSATLDNPLCGDRVSVEVGVREGRIAALAHRVRGCLLCQAAASLLGRAAAGSTPAEVEEARGRLAEVLRSGAEPPRGAWGDLAAFAPVGPVPSRHGCLLLPFDALVEALARASGRPGAAGTP